MVGTLSLGTLTETYDYDSHSSQRMVRGVEWLGCEKRGVVKGKSHQTIHNEERKKKQSC